MSSFKNSIENESNVSEDSTASEMTNRQHLRTEEKERKPQIEETTLKYNLLDSVESVDYLIPPLCVMKIRIDIDKRGKIANPNDSTTKIV